MSVHGTAHRHILLKPGELYVADGPCLVSTLLGSCVAITLYAPRNRLGAMCHALLPSCREPGRLACQEHFRHVECAVGYMMDAFRERGILCREIEAKVFGGADMFSVGPGGCWPDGRPTVGRQNMEKANEILAAEGVRIAVCDVGGLRGRKIIFSPHTGEVFLKRLNRLKVGMDEWPAGGAP
ncbi:MAG TPA: chemotaxis protein CheD [Geobacteraceae bacterium]